LTYGNGDHEISDPVVLLKNCLPDSLPEHRYQNHTAGFTLAGVVGDLDAGTNLIDAALAIDPNSAGDWYYGG
jgi:hypothetical protein